MEGDFIDDAELEEKGLGGNKFGDWYGESEEVAEVIVRSVESRVFDDVEPITLEAARLLVMIE